jgi:hypothetical protein
MMIMTTRDWGRGTLPLSAGLPLTKNGRFTVQKVGAHYYYTPVSRLMFTTKGQPGNTGCGVSRTGSAKLFNASRSTGRNAPAPISSSCARHFTLARWRTTMYCNRRGDKDRRFRASRENEMHGEVTFCQTGVALVRLFGGVYAPYSTGRAIV